jgi:two-component system sensor histidine kinase VicK
LREIKLMLITGWLVVLGIAVVIGFLLARTITSPIREVTSRAAAMAGGDFSQLIEVRSQDEIGELGKMFNFLTIRLQDTLKEISTEKNKVEAILNYMTDGIVALNREGKAIHLNPAARQLLKRSGNRVELGLPGEEILGNLINPEELPQLLQQTSPSIKEVQMGDEEGKTLQVYFAPFKEDGNPQGMLVVLHDVTRERILSRLQQEFVANVSHELRTPLTTIKNYVETLLNGAQDDPGVRLRFLEVVDKETDRMVKLVKDLLVLSQMDYHETNWLREKSDVISLIAEVLAQVELECRSKGIDLHDYLPRRKVMVLLNKDKIRQVLLNLIDNAIKYTPEGGEIKVSILTKYNFVWVTVKDTGIGIPGKEVDRVFERFFRVDKTRSRDSGGTGLGLPIAKQIVEAHGGSIYLKSELEKGTEVTFSLPLLEA